MEAYECIPCGLSTVNASWHRESTQQEERGTVRPFSPGPLFYMLQVSSMPHATCTTTLTSHTPPDR